MTKSDPNPTTKPEYYIGWDVGGWNCDLNARSRDAIVILDSALSVIGSPWRGNLRTVINKSTDTDEWLVALFRLCRAKSPSLPAPIIMAIDTPLGFPEEFIALVTGAKAGPDPEDTTTNRYLYRQTERHLFGKGLKPLSAIKDMIGSQATKGIHALAKFAKHVESCGVWTDQRGFTAIEAYPSACRNTQAIQSLLKGAVPLDHQDREDARICALIAYLFATRREALESPPDDISRREGWIWVPCE